MEFRNYNYIRRSLKVAIVVGFLLNIVNCYSDFQTFPWNWSLISIAKIVLNFTVPFFVHILFTEREIYQKIAQIKKLEEESSRLIRFPPSKNNNDAA